MENSSTTVSSEETSVRGQGRMYRKKDPVWSDEREETQRPGEDRRGLQFTEKTGEPHEGGKRTNTGRHDMQI